MPRSFSRKAVRPSRALPVCQNSLGIVSQPSISMRPQASSIACSLISLSSLSPRLALLPAPLATGALVLDAEIEFLDVFLFHQPRAGVGHDDATALHPTPETSGLQPHVALLRAHQHKHP